jgi:hypothetical protein
MRRVRRSVTVRRPIVMIDVSGSDAETAESGEVAHGMYWGVRDSFVQYVRGNPDGQLFGEDGVETDGEGMFRFPLRRAERSDRGWRLGFGGQVRFTAHFGMLDVALTRPSVELGPDGGTLRVCDRHGADIVIATLDPVDPVDLEGGWLVFPPIRTCLTAHGVAVFGDVYPEGTEFDALRIAVPASAMVAREEE